MLPAAALAAHQQPFHDRVRHAGRRLVRDGDGDAEVLADLPVLADQDFQDLAVDAVVAAVEGDDLDLVALLAVAVDASLALVVPGRVPREVVMDDGVEVVLEVDALRQAVGGDEDAAGGRVVGRLLGQLLDALDALLRRQRARHALDDGLAAELAVEVVADVLGGRDVAAEDDRVVAVLEQRLQVLDQGFQLQVGVRSSRSAARSARAASLAPASSVSAPGATSRPSRASLSAESRVSGAPSSSASSAVAADAAADRVRSVCAAARGDDTIERRSAIADHQAMRASRRPCSPRP